MKSAEEQSIEYLKKKQEKVTDRMEEWQMYRFAIDALEEKINQAHFNKPERPFLVIEHFEGETYESQVHWFVSLDEAYRHINGCRKDFQDNYFLDKIIEVGNYKEIEYLIK